MGTALTLSAILVASTAAALFLSRKPGGNDEAGGRLGPPGLSLAAVIAVIYINQVLFTVYVLRVRHGDPSFIARYLPAGWFALAHGQGAILIALGFLVALFSSIIGLIGVVLMEAAGPLPYIATHI